MRVLLQFPEGLKSKALKIGKEYENKGYEVFISSSPCYGACDIAIDEAKACKADKILHFGHAEFTKIGYPIEYVEWPFEVPYKGVMRKALVLLKNYRKIGLVTTVQHIKQVNEVKKFLEQNGKEVLTGRGGKVVRHDSQILGCDSGAARSIAKNVDCILYFGGGLFHPLGIEIDKAILVVDPFMKTARFIDQEVARMKRRRKTAISALVLAKKVGILLSTKVGQLNLQGALIAKKKLEEKGKEVYLLISNEINPDALINFGSFDCFVNTACPRLAEDIEEFKKPIVRYEDVFLL